MVCTWWTINYNNRCRKLSWFSDVIQGPWLMDQMRDQAKAVGTEMIEDHISSVNLKSTPFEAVVIVVKNILQIV